MSKSPEFPAYYRGFSMKLSESRDLPELGAIVERVFHEYGWVFSLPAELPDFLDFEAHYVGNTMKPGSPRLFTIRTENDRICGVIALKYNKEGACLSRVYVDENLRGQGIGKWMIQQILDLAVFEGEPHIHLWTDTKFLGAHRLYKRLGFTMTTTLKPLHDTNRCFEWKMIKELS